MPQLVAAIDAIAREKNRDVLFVHFENYIEDKEFEDNARDTLLAWLDEQGIAYAPCMGIEDQDLVMSYLGDIYIDVPFDEDNPTYQILRDHLEDEEGNMKIEDVYFYVLSLEVALEIQADRLAEQEHSNTEDFFDDAEHIEHNNGRLS